MKAQFNPALLDRLLKAADDARTRVSRMSFDDRAALEARGRQLLKLAAARRR